MNPDIIKKPKKEEKNKVRKWVCRDCGKNVPCKISIEEKSEASIDTPSIITENTCIMDDSLHSRADWKEKTK